MSLTAVFLGSALLDVALLYLVLRGLRRRRIRRAAELGAFSVQLMIAKDLHDGPLQFMAGLVLRLNVLRVAILEQAVPRETLDAQLNQLLSDIQIEQRDLRRTIENLLGHEDDAPVEPSCSALLTLLANRWGLDTKLSPSNADDLIPQHLARDINFILKEAASNAAHHGRARKFAVKVERASETLQLEIIDNGSGFNIPRRPGGNTDEYARPPISIEWRVRKLHGRFAVESDETGTRLSIGLPLRG